MLSSNLADDSVLASFPDILLTVQVYRPFHKKKVTVFLFVLVVLVLVLFLPCSAVQSAVIFVVLSRSAVSELL